MNVRPDSKRLACLLLCFSSASAGQESPATTESTIISSVGFMTGELAGSGPYWFLIDTGANRSALDSNVARSLALTVTGFDKVEGTAGTIGVRQTILPTLTLGSAVIRNLRSTVSDLSASLAPQGAHISGILGSDALRESAVFWDRENGRVEIANSAEDLASLNGAARVPFKLDNGIPRIAATIDGQRVNLRIDTGASIGEGPTTFVNVTHAFYIQLRTRHRDFRPYAYFTATGVGGQVNISVVKANTLKIGAVIVCEPHLIVQQPVGYFARKDAVGFLGGYAFNNWRGFIIDYPHRQLILLPKLPLRHPSESQCRLAGNRVAPESGQESEKPSTRLFGGRESYSSPVEGSRPSIERA